MCGAPGRAVQPRLLQGKEFDSVREVFGLSGSRDQRQVANALSDRHLELVSVNDSQEGVLCLLSALGLGKEIRVLREEESAQPDRAVQKVRVL